MVSINNILHEYNIVGLSIAVAIGIAGQELVFSLNNDVVMPSVAKLLPYGFLNDYKFDIDNFFSKAITFIFVFVLIIILLITILKPLVQEKINNEKKFNNIHQKRLETLQKIEKELTTNINNSLTKVHESVVQQTNLIHNQTVGTGI